jgi:hypothetical protein
MLPTFPLIERHRARHNRERIRQLVRQMAPLVAAISPRVQHEGGGFTMERHDDEAEAVPTTKVSAELSFEKLRLADFTSERRDAMLLDAATQMAIGQMAMITKTLDEVTERTGNVVDGEGRPFDEEKFIDAMEKMEHAFDERGNWKIPSMFGGGAEANAEGIRKAFASQRLKIVIDRKRDEFRRREAARILVG